MTTEPEKLHPPHHEPDGAEDWRHLRGNVRHQTVGMIEEIFALLRILLQDAVILVAGFAVEFAFEHWLHSEQPAFRMALNISSILFLLLYCVMVTVHFVRYLREQVETIKPGAAGGHAAAAAAVKMPAGSRRYIAVGIASAVAVALLVGAVIYLRRGGLGGHSAGNGGASGEPINTLAVLALENASGDPENEYLGDGIAESLISSLSQLPQLKVMSRDSAFSFKGKQTEVNEIGQQLGVRAVFKGQVKQIGDSLMVSVELIDTTDKHQIWGQQYLRKSADIFALQQEIARDISDKLKLKLTGADQQNLAKRGTESAEAYQAYIKGRFWWNKRSEAGYKKAIDFFTSSIEIDPGYALAYSGLADAYSLTATYALAPPGEAIPKARAAALKALSLDESLAEAHTSLAWIAGNFDRDWVLAEKEYLRAMELNPNYATAPQWYGLYYLVVHERLDEGLASTKRAQQLDPLSPIISQFVANTYYYSRNYDQAISELRRVLDLEPEWASGHSFLGRSLAMKGSFDDAISMAEKAASMTNRGSREIQIVGVIYAQAGRKTDARRILGELNERSKHQFVPATYPANILLALGEKDRAIEWLEKAVAAHEDQINLIKVDPWYDSLRSDPRYHDLLRRMNLE